jgi:hypothetical protein
MKWSGRDDKEWNLRNFQVSLSLGAVLAPLKRYLFPRVLFSASRNWSKCRAYEGIEYVTDFPVRLRGPR